MRPYQEREIEAGSSWVGAEYREKAEVEAADATSGLGVLLETSVEAIGAAVWTRPICTVLTQRVLIVNGGEASHRWISPFARRLSHLNHY